MQMRLELIPLAWRKGAKYQAGSMPSARAQGDVWEW